MTTGNDKGKGKEREREREPEAEPVAQKRPDTWPGHLQNGKWFCECNRRAICYTVNDVAKPNYGKKFWTCSKPRDHKCNFFLWDEDDEEARQWHTDHDPPPPAPQTPKANEKILEEPSKDLGNPWTKSISKRKPRSREVSDEDETGGPPNRNVEVAELSDFEDVDTSRKAVKVTRFCTPGQTDKSKSAAESLPTPDTGGQPLGVSRPLRGESPSPQLADAIILRNGGKRSLSATVLKLIHSEQVKLRESITIQIEHEIDTEVAMYEEKLRGYERTNIKLSARLDEMENMVLLLGGDVAADASVEFSE